MPGPDSSGSAIGLGLPRAEDAELLNGSARFVGDLLPDGCLHLAFVRNREPHARLLGVSLERARAAPGVATALAAADLGPSSSMPSAPWLGLPEAFSRPVLARDRVRFVGEPVAVVVAEHRARGEDAAELAEVALEPLPPVLDPTEGADSASPRLFESESNVVLEERAGHEDAGAAVMNAPVVVEGTFRIGRLAHLSLEARAVLAVPEPRGGLTVWCSHQAPHRLRSGLAAALGLDAGLIRVRVPAVGGAFGGKSQTYPEYVLACRLALELGRPVRWVEDRREAFLAAVHGRGSNIRLRVGAARDGTLLALETAIDGDLGAYPETGALVPTFAAWLISGPYRIPRLSSVVRGVVTNKPPTAPYRGAGRPEAAYVLERSIDLLADRLRLDPGEVRRRNLIPADAFPYASPTGAVYDSGDYRRALDRALELAAYEELRRDEAWRLGDDLGGRVVRGVGMAVYVERSGGTSDLADYARVDLEPDGTLTIRSGACSHGQGHRTALAQVAAAALEVDLDRVRVVQGDTAEVSSGGGTFGSRSMQIGGAAVHLACCEFIALAIRRAAEALGTDRASLQYEGGMVRSAGTELPLEDLACRTGPLSAESRFSGQQAFPFGAYVATVDIDRETGAVRVTRLVAVDDCGVVVNPLLLEGQIQGSIVQGLGQALTEEVGYEPDGRPTTATLFSYVTPGPVELPDLVLDRTVTPNPNVPTGAKGGGEAGTIGAPPAIVNAIVDALRGYDTSVITMPVTPEVVWKALSSPRRVG
ncbi:MAG TPA: xanthine dehydrogenase family protein molybdopterin-binding subunit [Actinomycetota bacterium]